MYVLLVIEESLKSQIIITKNQIDVFIYEDANVYVANTGYTGEAGFELVAPNEVITQLWNLR